MKTFRELDMLDRFEPLSKEEQKDLLFIILESMGFYWEAMEGAKTEEDEREFFAHYSLYQFMVKFLVKDRDWMSDKDLMLKGAHLDRLKWEKERKERDS